MALVYDVQAVDVVCNFQLDDPEVRRPSWSQDFLRNKIGVDPAIIAGLSPEHLIEKMDRAGVMHAFLIAVRAGSSAHAIDRRISYEKVA